MPRRGPPAPRGRSPLEFTPDATTQRLPGDNAAWPRSTSRARPRRRGDYALRRSRRRRRGRPSEPALACRNRLPERLRNTAIGNRRQTASASNFVFGTMAPLWPSSSRETPISGTIHIHIARKWQGGSGPKTGAARGNMPGDGVASTAYLVAELPPKNAAKAFVNRLFPQSGVPLRGMTTRRNSVACPRTGRGVMLAAKRGRESISLAERPVVPTGIIAKSTPDPLLAMPPGRFTGSRTGSKGAAPVLE